MFPFYPPWKSQRTKDLLTFTGGIEMNIRLKWNKSKTFLEHLSKICA